jgi:uncharacterized OB-fold protein
MERSDGGAVTYTKTLPVPGALDSPYWQGLRRREVLVQRCSDCGVKQWYPREVCSRCHSFALGWTPVEPVGTVYTYSVQHQKTGSKFDEDIPYAVLVVELTGAPEVHLVGQLVGDPGGVKIGTPVVGDFLDATPEITILNWRTR